LLEPRSPVLLTVFGDLKSTPGLEKSRLAVDALASDL
jgi:hypothetical protein